MKLRIVLQFVLILVIFNLNAQIVNKSKLDSFFSFLNEKNKTMGSISISKNGKQIYSNAIGFCAINSQLKLPANGESKYRVGSVTKTFTATMVFQLIEENKLALSVTLNQFFPQIPNASNITIGNLLNHRSGLSDFINDTNYSEWTSKPRTKVEILNFLSKGKVLFSPDMAMQYSNTNYLLLGYIIESITGKSYSENIRSRITDPLKMNHTYVGVEINPSKNECYSYAYNGVWEQREERDMSMPGGAGNIVSTPNDLVVFITALFNHKLVSDSSLKKMKSIKNGIGMGLNEYEFNGVIAYGHLGGIDGFSAVMGYFPMDSMAISYTTNGQFYALKDIMLGCLAICFNKPYKLPSSSILVRKDILEKFIGDYTSEQLPVKIKITMKDSQLYAKFKGEEPFKLEAKGNNKFSYEEGDIQVVFNADTNEMTMRQVGKVFLFRRKGK